MRAENELGIDDRSTQCKEVKLLILKILRQCMCLKYQTVLNAADCTAGMLVGCRGACSKVGLE